MFRQVLNYESWLVVLTAHRIFPFHNKCAMENELEYVLINRNWEDLLYGYVKLALDPQCLDQDVPFLTVTCARCGDYIPNDIRVAINLIAGKRMV